MLFPYMAGRVERAQAFERLSQDTPDLLVHRWAQYRSDVPSLGPEESAKIQAMAADIVTSFATPFPVRALLLQGHADYDHLKTGAAREEFEFDISRKRARAVRDELRRCIDRQARSPHEVAMAWMLYWELQGLGSKRRVHTTPKTEEQRAMNRRVEVFVARGARPRTGTPVMACPHGGTVTRGPFAIGQPSVHHGWVVVGCWYKTPQEAVSPCVTVRWLANGPSLVIDRDTVGQCLNIQGGVQGQVMMA